MCRGRSVGRVGPETTRPGRMEREQDRVLEVYQPLDARSGVARKKDHPHGDEPPARVEERSHFSFFSGGCKKWGRPHETTEAAAVVESHLVVASHGMRRFTSCRTRPKGVDMTYAILREIHGMRYSRDWAMNQ